VVKTWLPYEIEVWRDASGGEHKLAAPVTVFTTAHPLQFPSVATNVDEAYTMPVKASVSTAEKAARVSLKLQSVELKPFRWEELGFGSAVCQAVREVPLRYLGDWSRQEYVQPYAWKDFDTWVMAVQEADRMETVRALELPQGICTKVHAFVVVFKKEYGGVKTRVCVDYSTMLNPHVPDVPFTLPMFHDLAQYISTTGESWLAKFDLQDGFFALRFSQEASLLMGVLHPRYSGKPGWKCPPSTYQSYLNMQGDHIHNGIRCHRRLPFGYKLSPAEFCSVTEAVAAYLRSQGVPCVCFVDDFGVVASSREECMMHMAKVESLLSDLGWIVAPHKKEGPVKVMDFLGMQVDARADHCCFRLPPLKMVVIRDGFLHLKQIKDSGVWWISAGELAALVGRLNFASQVVLPGRLYLRKMWNALAPAHVYWSHGELQVKWGSMRLYLNDDFCQDMEWWVVNIVGCNHWSFSSACNSTVPIELDTDASTLGGGAALHLPFDTHEMSVQWNKTETAYHINWKELCMVCWALWRWLVVIQGRSVCAVVDNTTAKSCIAKMSSKSEALQVLTVRIHMMMMFHQALLTARHKAGKKHVQPDGLSRGTRPQPPSARLNKHTCSLAETCMGPFAFKIGREQVDMWPTSATEMVWHRGAAWIHPRFDQAAECVLWVLKQISAAPLGSKQAVLVLPHRPSAPWWRWVEKLPRLHTLLAGSSSYHEMQHGHMWTPHSCGESVVMCICPAIGMKVLPIVTDALEAADNEAKRGMAGTGGSWFWVPLEKWELPSDAIYVLVVGAHIYGWLYQSQASQVFTDIDGNDFLLAEFWGKSPPHAGKLKPLQYSRYSATHMVIPEGGAKEWHRISPHSAFDVTPYVDDANWMSNRATFDAAAWTLVWGRLPTSTLGTDDAQSNWSSYSWQGLTDTSDLSVGTATLTPSLQSGNSHLISQQLPLPHLTEALDLSDSEHRNFHSLIAA
jgi:hypothetical protein